MFKNRHKLVVMLLVFIFSTFNISPVFAEIVNRSDYIYYSVSFRDIRDNDLRVRFYALAARHNMNIELASLYAHRSGSISMTLPYDGRTTVNGVQGVLPAIATPPIVDECCYDYDETLDYYPIMPLDIPSTVSPYGGRWNFHATSQRGGAVNTLHYVTGYDAYDVVTTVSSASGASSVTVTARRVGSIFSITSHTVSRGQMGVLEVDNNNQNHRVFVSFSASGGGFIVSGSIAPLPFKTLPPWF